MTPLTSRWRIPRQHVVPLAVWLSACGLAALVALERTSSSEFLGIGRGRVTEVAAPFAGRVKEVLVAPAERVQRGQIVALLDDTVVRGQIAAIRAEAERVAAEHAAAHSLVEADVAQRVAEWWAEDRAFTSDSVQLQLQIAELRTAIESERELERGLRFERDHLRAASDEGLTSRLELERVVASHAVASSRVAALERQIEEAEQEYATSVALHHAYREQFPRPAPSELVLGHGAQAVQAQRALLAEFEALADLHALRAPCDGVVVDLTGQANDVLTRRPGEAVLRVPGESVDAGEPVLAIAETEPSEIVAWVGDSLWTSLRPGTEITVTASRGQSGRHATRVRAVHPTIERLPERLWPAPNVPAWGRPVLLEIPPGLELLPGEIVRGAVR